MGRSRNKVAVPEGAAGTPPFWRRSPVRPLHLIIYIYDEELVETEDTGRDVRKEQERKKEAAARMPDIIRKVVRPALLAVSLILKARE